MLSKVYHFSYLVASAMSKHRVLQFTNCHLIKADGIEYKNDLWINGNKISSELKHADIIIDCKKLYISPGYIDLQINGESVKINDELIFRTNL